MKKILLVCLVGMVCLLTPLAGYCWGAMGHRVVAKIAYNRLTAPQRKWVDGLLLSLADAPQEIKKSFVEAATWPDVLKSKKVTDYNSWHFTNIPYKTDNVVVPPKETPAVNVVWAIHRMDSTLRQPGTSAAQAAQALSFLTHFIGDLHQPLHSTSRHSKSKPEGDRGGNLFLLKGGKNDNLHALWDDGCSYFDAVKKMKDANLKELKGIDKVVAVVTKAYPPEKLKNLQELDPQAWAEESHELAVTYAYNGKQGTDGTTLKPGEAPTQFYLEAAQKIVAQRLAAGGYRLAMVLDAIYKALNPG